MMWTEPEERPGFGPDFPIGFFMGVACTISVSLWVGLIWWLLS